MKFKEWLKLTEAVSLTYDRNQFVRLPWNWQAMQQAKIVMPMYYYAKENYINGQPEQLTDDQWSFITLPNLKSIPSSELSAKNLASGRHTDVTVNQMEFLKKLQRPRTWYDDKIDQVYNGIQMLGKRPEDFGGKDIRNKRQNG